jgi:serine/threonine-protein kinase
MDTDRNLLFGVLALQADLINPERFAQACTLWSADKSTPLADLLVRQGWLTDDDRADVEKLLGRKLRKHQGDARAGLAEATPDSLRQSLAGLDNEVRHSLGFPAEAAPVALATTGYVPEMGERYTRSRLHATGGIGRVWLARDAHLARDVALKELRPERAGNPAVWARFLKEAQITGQLEHPGIVPIYEVGKRSDDQAPSYTMRFVRGRTLGEAVRAYHQRRQHGESTPLELRELLGNFVGVCNAVAYAHNRGVIHRDLKPKNVVLGDFGEVIVLDWGLARLIDQPDAEQAAPMEVPAESEVAATVQGQVLGTPAYMAPEQAEGRLDQLGPATDVYGLGAILYEILTGRPPFTGAETTEVLRLVIHEPPVRPRHHVAGTPAALEAVCLRALAKKPADRYSSASELANEVRHYLADEPVSAYREPPTKRLARWGRRHRSLVAGAAALLVALVVGLTAGTVLLGQANARIRREQAETRKERDRADANFQKAQTAVDEYLTQVSENTLLKSPLPGLQPLRKELLRTALKYYESFVAEHQEDPSLRAELARAHARAGKLGITLGSKEEGYSSLRQARDLLEKLVQEQPERAEHRAELVDVYLLLGKAPIRKPEESAERLADLRRALELAEQLIQEDSGSNDYRALLAKSFNYLARWQADSKHADEELSSLQRAAAMWNELARRDSRFRRDAASAAMNLGYYYTRLGNPLCLRFHEEARAQLEELLRVDSADVEVLAELRRVYTNIGYAHHLLESRPELALRSYDRAGGVLEQLTRDHPAVVSYQHQKAVNLSMMASALIPMKDGKRADSYLRDAQQILERLHKQNPDDVAVMNVLGDVHVHRGRLNLLLRQKPREAVEELKRAGQWHEKAFKANPGDMEFRTAVARTMRDLGMAQQSAGDLAAAERSLLRSVEVNEQVEAGSRGRNMLVPRQLVAGYSMLAGVAEARGNIADAARHHDRMMRVWEKELAPSNRSAEMLNLVAQANFRHGNALMNAGRLDAALEALRKAVALKPEYAEAQCNLGHCLIRLGRFAEGRAALQLGHELGIKQPGWIYPSRSWVRNAERLIQLDERLAAILAGKAEAADNRERLALALLCQQHKHQHAAAARFFAEAFSDEPKFAEDLKALHRYNAACSAALAAAGQGRDAPKPDDKERARLRRQALGWLQADLALWGKEAQKGTPEARAAVQKALRHWQKDSDLAGVREAAALAKLSEAERAAWRKLWGEVAALLKE